MAKVKDALLKAERYLVIICFSIMVIAMAIQVFNREVMKQGLGWAEELARFSMIYLVFLGTEITLRENKQFSIEVVRGRCPPWLRRLFDYISKMAVITFSIIVVIGSVPLVYRQIRNGQITPGMNIPMYIPYLALACFVFITLVQLGQLGMMIVSDVSERGGRRV